MIKYLILAGNHNEASHWAKKKKLKTSEWLYIFNIEQLHGYNINENQTELVLVGTYHKRSDLGKIMDELAWNGYVV